MNGILAGGLLALSGIAIARGASIAIGCAPRLTDAGAMQVLLLLLVAPVLEEYVVRRGAHQAIADALRRSKPALAAPIAIIGSALLFGALHLRAGLSAACWAVLPAIAIGLLFHCTRRWQICAAAHAAFNASALLVCNSGY